MSERALSPAIGSVLLVAVTVTIAVVIGTTVLGTATTSQLEGDGPPTASFSATGSAVNDEIRIVHEGGGTIDVSSLDGRVAVDGEPLDYQPPVPFFAAKGFASGPTGPFNPSTNQTWTAGEAATFALAGTNSPAIDPGDEVRIRLIVDGTVIVTLRISAGSAGDIAVRDDGSWRHGPGGELTVGDVLESGRVEHAVGLLRIVK